MEPVTLIVTALVAGASAAANTTVQAVTADAYKHLKELIRKRFGSDHDKQAALERVEGDPTTSVKPLAEALTISGIDEDAAEVGAARTVLESLDPVAVKKYSLKVEGDVRGLVQGDHNTVTMNF